MIESFFKKLEKIRIISVLKNIIIAKYLITNKTYPKKLLFIYFNYYIYSQILKIFKKDK
jgi:hypothetical protein